MSETLDGVKKSRENADRGACCDAGSGGIHASSGPERTKSTLEQVVNVQNEIRFLTTQEGKLIDISAAGVELFGYASKEEMLLLDSSSRLLWDPQDRDLFRDVMEEKGSVECFELPMRRKDGSKFIGCITARTLTGADGAVLYEGALQDITEWRAWQRALIDSEKQNRLLAESEERCRNLNEDILRMLMIMSHDIRGPLVAMAATLKLLIRGSYGKMDESVLNTVKDLLARVAQLLGIAEDFLGKASSIQGTFSAEREVLDLRQDVIDPVLDELSNEILTNSVMIDNRLGAIPAGTIRINVNKVWLKAVFRNLFSNAIKYGGKGCTIAFGFEDHGSYYRLNVYNSGTPVPEEYRDRLFTQFGRIEGESKKTPAGVGLGLYLIKEIIRKHGGDIWYEAKHDGSDFIFTIAKERASGCDGS